MRDKLIELLDNAIAEKVLRSSDGKLISTFPFKVIEDGMGEWLADYLIAHGVTVQTDVSDNNVGNKLEITAALKTAKIISYHLRKDFPFSANIIAAQIAHDLMAQGLLEVE